MRVAFVFTFLLFGSFVRTQSDDDIDGSIVDAEDLQGNKPTEGFEENPHIECNELEEYSRCHANPLCQRTCETFSKDSMVGIPCPRSKSCIEGCVCKEDYVRLVFYEPCVHHEQCEIYQNHPFKFLNQ